VIPRLRAHLAAADCDGATDVVLDSFVLIRVLLVGS
jgi:hypothetical protein